MSSCEHECCVGNLARVCHEVIAHLEQEHLIHVQQRVNEIGLEVLSEILGRA